MKTRIKKSIGKKMSKGSTVKKKFQDGGSTPKSSKNPLTGRTRVTEGWKEKPAKTTGTVPPRPPGYAEKKVDVYDKKGNKIKTINKTRTPGSRPNPDKFFSKGKATPGVRTRKVTKYRS